MPEQIEVEILLNEPTNKNSIHVPKVDYLTHKKTYSKLFWNKLSNVRFLPAVTPSISLFFKFRRG